MIDDIAVISTEDLSEAQRRVVIDVCETANDNEEFRKLFTTYIPRGGRHFLAYRDGVLVSHAVVTMRRLGAEIDDFEIGCLQTDRTGFYERLGWQLWRGPLAGRGEHGLIPTPEQRGVMVLPLSTTPPIDLDAQLTIECQPARIWE